MGFGGVYCLLSCERARREVGYSPRYTLKTWVQDYIARARLALTAADKPSLAE